MKSLRNFMQRSSVCEKDRQSRILLAGGAVLHAIAHGTARMGSLWLPMLEDCAQ